MSVLLIDMLLLLLLLGSEQVGERTKGKATRARARKLHQSRFGAHLVARARVDVDHASERARCYVISSLASGGSRRRVTTTTRAAQVVN